MTKGHERKASSRGNVRMHDEDRADYMKELIEDLPTSPPTG